MKRKMLVAASFGLASLALPSIAHAGACEDSFQRRGSAISGLRYIATITVPDLPINAAINQMRGIAARKGYSIIAAEPDSGALLIEQAMSSTARGFPVEINATQAGAVGTVTMEAKLRAGMSAPLEGAKTEMCGMLAELKGGRAGRQAAAAGANAVVQQSAPVAISAQAFSQQISKDAERNAASIPQRYANRRYTLSGDIRAITPDGPRHNISFRILQPHEQAIRLPGQAATLSEVVCQMAQGTSVFVMQQKPGNRVKLTGTYDDFSETRDVVWLKGCVAEPRR